MLSCRPSLPGCVVSRGLLGQCATSLTTTTTSTSTPATHTSALTLATSSILGRHTPQCPHHTTSPQDTVTPLVTTTTTSTTTPQATTTTSTVPSTPSLNAAQKHTSFPVLGSHVPQSGGPACQRPLRAVLPVGDWHGCGLRVACSGPASHSPGLRARRGTEGSVQARGGCRAATLSQRVVSSLGINLRLLYGCQVNE